MLHHLSLPVSDISRSDDFYHAALAALGYDRVWAYEHAVGYGYPGGGDQFAIKLSQQPVAVTGAGFHVAFAAPDRDSVARFHAEALAHGGRDNGPAGPRPQYGVNYYAAFVIDPDGYRLEAVINVPV